MAIDTDETFTIVGAGPVGCVLATLLARRGISVRLFEKRPDMRRAELGGGRSINLVLTERGLRTLHRIGLRDDVLALTVPVLGRMMHSRQGELTYQPYGRDDTECNYSVSRDGLNAFLLDAAEAQGAKIHFQHELVDVDFEHHQLRFRRASGEDLSESFEILIGCDGAPSAVRQALVEADHVRQDVSFMDWGYKELLFPSGPDGKYAMDDRALHIWPRGSHFLMGLANLDGSFTGTVYLPRNGPNSFETLDDPTRLDDFFTQHYPDAIPLLGEFVEEFLARPTGRLGTVRCAPWHLDNRVLLLGDAAHGIVPFFGQGLNCGFEDCRIFDELLQSALQEGWGLARTFQRFYERRKPNTDAIADMALENAVEMGEKVANPEFLLHKKVESKLEQYCPDIYRSRYALVMYSHIPYRVAQQIGERQKELLSSLCEPIEEADEVDLARARTLIESTLSPLYKKYGVELIR